MKRLRYENGPLDDIDQQILNALSDNARVSLATLARQVGLSSPSVSERIKRLEEAGVIGGYTLRVNPVALGLPLSAWLRIRPIPGQLQKVVEIIHGLPAIVECDRVTGEDCFLARACPLRRGTRGLDRRDHPIRHDQHLDHSILAGGASAACHHQTARSMNITLIR